MQSTRIGDIQNIESLVLISMHKDSSDLHAHAPWTVLIPYAHFWHCASHALLEVSMSNKRERGLARLPAGRGLALGGELRISRSHVEGGEYPLLMSSSCWGRRGMTTPAPPSR